ncbi:MAG: hypothetical protein WC766_06305 [Patescibacteria group bacterium]|jgi:hypothetical protein
MSKQNLNQAPPGIPLKRVESSASAVSDKVGKVEDEAPLPEPFETTDAVERSLDAPDEDEQEDEDDAREEAEDFEDKLDGVGNFEPAQNVFGESNVVTEMENEGDKLKVILEGARSTNPHYANIIPFDLTLAKIKDTDDRQNARLGSECLVLAVDMFGFQSLPAAHLWEELKTEIEIMRADKGFAAQLMVTQIQQSQISKKVSKQEQRANRGGLLGGVRRENQPNEQGDAFY